MTITPAELQEKSDFYHENAADWRLYQLAYEGTKALIENSDVLDDPKRKSEDVAFRKKSAWGEDLTQWIIDIIADFVNTVPFIENWGPLADDWAFQQFLRDCDLYGSDWPVFWNNSRRATYATGMTGILVDKAQTATKTADVAKDKGVYPYLARFSPLKVYIANWERNKENNRPELNYLKVEEIGKIYKIWTQENWEAYKINDDGIVEDAGSGDNPLGEIPFLWYYNLKSVFDNFKGISDAKLSAIMDKSIIKATADLSDVIDASAYLMLAMPEASLIDREGELKVGPREIIPYISDDGGAQKPYWLTPEVLPIVEAVLMIIQKQESVAIRSKNLSSIFSTESDAARSGESIKQAFRFLEAMLNRKVDEEIEARKGVIRLWLKWQEREQDFEKIKISHPKKYDIESLIITIADAMTAKTIITSSATFIKEIDKRIAARVAPDMPKDVQQTIDAEIDAGKVVLPKSVTDFKE